MKTFREYLIENATDNLVHFTSLNNLKLILKDGILKGGNYEVNADTLKSGDIDSNIDEICLFYGADDWLNIKKFECGEKQVKSSYTYTGDVQVVLFNKNLLYKTILLEVTKDWVENSEIDYYFLADDLTENEKEFFDSCYEQIRCDFIYNLNNSLEKSYQKKLGSRIK